VSATAGRALVLDVDTGVDDALALLVAVRSPMLRVLGVGCVAGNIAAEQAVDNTLRLLAAAGAGDVPVAAGMRRPLLAAPSAAARRTHGRDGMADLGLPAPRRRAERDHAVELLRRIVRTASQQVSLVALGPLTDVAVLVRMYPGVVARLDRMVVAAGGEEGEFNAAYDPEATRIVFGSGLPLTRVGLDVARRVTVPAVDVAALEASPEPAAQLAGRLLRHRAGPAGTAAALGDAVAVLAVLAPDGLVTARVGGVEVAVGVDTAAYRRRFLGAVRGIDVATGG
jgi:pyrimidine-specific ribonucleoside hydrolase